MIGLISGHAENIGYIIPNQEIDDFLTDVADGHYEGKPYIFDQFQTMENEALREQARPGQERAGADGPRAEAPRRLLPAQGVRHRDPDRYG